MVKRSKKNPFGGNPFGAPALPFDFKMPDAFSGAEDFDIALGLEKQGNRGFDEISDGFNQFGRKNNGRRKRRTGADQFAIERQLRKKSGQESLGPQEDLNYGSEMDAFGRPLTE